MIDEKAVENIQTYGVYQDSGTGRNKVLFEDLGLNADKEAEYVIIAGCVQPEGMPHAFSALKNVFERLQINYTFLSKDTAVGGFPLANLRLWPKMKRILRDPKSLPGNSYRRTSGRPNH